jgi:hypothetical protein
VQPTFPSPNAAALGKYGDIPVNSHTGVPSISVPIFTVEEGDLKLPISMSYHASGIRVSEVASWVGLGWSLSAGGMITRSVNGGPDEGIQQGSMSGAKSPYVGRGWYKDYGILPELIMCGNRPLSVEGPVLGTNPSWLGCGQLYYEAAKGYIDTEPDLYTFNFAGYSGKFFFDTNRKIHMIPEADVYIEPVNSPNYFYSWKIIAPDGTKYFFGGSATEITYSDPGELGSNKHVSSSTTWYLYKVESVNGEDWINLQYAEDSYSFGNRGGHSVTFREFTGGNCFGCAPGDVVGDIYNVSTVPNTSNVDGRRLSKITTSSGHTTLDFYPSAAAREDLTKYDKSSGLYDVQSPNTISKSLGSIQISYGAICKKFDFSYDYFSSATCTGCLASGMYNSTFDTKRLRLNSIQESSCSGTFLPKYEFTYNATLLPRRYSMARDTWEYYNGIEANRGLLEQFTNPVVGMTYTTGNFRTVNETYTKAGILTRIKYPTGGTSDFDYECHRVSTGSPLVGGLRVKSIVNSDNMGNTITKNFTYANGKLYLNPVNYEYQYPNNNDVFSYAFLGAFDFGITHSSNPTPPMWSSHGYHFGYEQATVDQTGNGSTTYNYMNIAPAMINPGQFPLKPLVAAVGTGETLSEEVKKNDGTLIKSSTNNRGMTGPNITSVMPRKVQLVTALNMPGEYGIWTDYYISTNRYNLIEKTETQDGVTITTTNTYDATGKHNNPTATQFTDSKGIVQREETVYATDAGSGAPAAMHVSTDPNFKNMIGVPIEQKKLVAGVVKSRSVNQFTNSAGKILLTKTIKYPSGTAESVETSYEYNANSNPVVFKKNDGVNFSYLWGYNNAYPIAEIKNAIVPAVSLASLLSTKSITGNVSTWSTVDNGSLIIPFPQTVSFSVSVNGNAGVSFQLKLSIGGVDYFPAKTYVPGAFNESVYLPAGTYQYNFTATGYAGYGSISINTSYQSNLGRSRALHTSFEDTGVTDGASKTGKKVLNGTYSITMPDQIGAYVITYWKRPTGGGAWVFQEQTVTTASATPPNEVIGQAGYSIDEVRMYPKGAEMTTYTYEPGLGILSMTDSNNLISYYEYDILGRLKVIKNDKGEIQKQYSYNYKTN